MSTKELFSNIFENIKKENPKLKDEELKAKVLEDVNSKSQIAKEELLSPKLTKNTLDEYINKTIGNENISKEQRELIHELHKIGLVDNLKSSQLPKNTTGRYTTDVFKNTSNDIPLTLNDITLNNSKSIPKKTKAQVLTHEYIHSATMNLIRKNPRFNAELSLIHSEAKKSFQKQGLDINTYGFTKPSEFIAEAFSNPAFAKELNSVKVSNVIKKI